MEQNQAENASGRRRSGKRKIGSSVQADRTDLFTLVSSKCAGLSPKTVSTYVTRLGILRDKLEDAKDRRIPRGDFSWMTKCDRLVEFVTSEWPAEQTQRLTFAALKCAVSGESGSSFRKAERVYENEVARLNQIANLRYQTQSLSPKERQKWMSWDDIEARVNKHVQDYWPRLETLDEWTEEEFRLAQEILMVKLYTMLPLRNEYGTLKSQRYKEHADNYVDWARRELVFNDFKTVKSHGQNRLVVEDPVVWSMLTRNREMNQGSDFLFVNVNGDPYSGSMGWSQHVGRVFERLCGKKLTSSLLRKSLITKVNENQPRIEQQLPLQALASQMGHSFSTQQTYRRYNDGDIDQRLDHIRQRQSLFSTQPSSEKAAKRVMTVEKLRELTLPRN